MGREREREELLKVIIVKQTDTVFHPSPK